MKGARFVTRCMWLLLLMMPAAHAESVVNVYMSPT